MKLLTHAEQRIIQEALADRREMGESNQPDDAKIAALCDTLEAAEGLVGELTNLLKRASAILSRRGELAMAAHINEALNGRARQYLEARGK